MVAGSQPRCVVEGLWHGWLKDLPAYRGRQGMRDREKEGTGGMVLRDMGRYELQV